MDNEERTERTDEELELVLAAVCGSKWWVSPCRGCLHMATDGNCTKGNYKKGCPMFRRWFCLAWKRAVKLFLEKENEHDGF